MIDTDLDCKNNYLRLVDPQVLNVAWISFIIKQNVSSDYTNTENHFTTTFSILHILLYCSSPQTKLQNFTVECTGVNCVGNCEKNLYYCQNEYF